MIYLFQIFPPAICYFLYNWQFFRCVESILNIKPLPKRSIMLTFFLNYSIFMISSLLKFHLIVNWIIFLILLLAEQLIFYHQPARKCALFALLGTQLGLAINILCRSLIAIVLDVPLIAFDNRVSAPGNMKMYPVLLGFLIVGILFMLIARFHLLARLTLAIEDQSTLIFFLALLVAMYFYLCMNLVFYYIDANNLTLKLWSMKSALFVILGECLSIILSIRLGQISEYRAKSLESQEQLAREQLREFELHTIASTDPLTGCKNRLNAIPRLKEAFDDHRIFSLGFVDLNGLKSVNDKFGHESGDKYILAVSHALKQICGEGDCLFRYGGDEFLLLMNCSVSDTAERLNQTQQQLQLEAERHTYPFSMEISYGVASPQDGTSPADLIKAADTRMYEMKQALYSKHSRLS